MNFASGFTTESEYRGAWPAETFARLIEVKSRYDPDGIFAYGSHEPTV